MFDKQAIITDFETLLDGIAEEFQEGESRGDTAVYPAIAIGVPFIRPAFLAASGINSGFYTASVQIDCITYIDDDKPRTGVNALQKQALAVINTDTILHDLNAISTYTDYRGITPGDSFEDDEENLRHEILQFDFQIGNKTTN